MLQAADASLSYASARQLAAEEAFGEKARLLSEPNDILAVEYLKAAYKLGNAMRPLAVARAGSGHDSMNAGEYLSAKALRAMLRNGEGPGSNIPEPAIEVFYREMAAKRTPDESLLEIAILSRLYKLAPQDFDQLPDAGGGAGRRLYRAIWNFDGMEEIVQKAVSKRYTASRMRRMLYYAALGICADDTKGSPPYIRVLALNEKGRAHLAEYREKADLPIINKYNKCRKLSFQAEKVFKLCANAHELYCLVCPSTKRSGPGEDWRRSPVIV
jgi:predicted nucleotidyltransferase